METALRSASPAGFTAENTNLFSSDSSGEDGSSDRRWTVETCDQLVMASWTTDDGCIDISAPSRPGIVNSYILHRLKINGEFYQHAFAIVWWYKADCDESYFGKPA